MQTIKNSLFKAAEESRDIYVVLLDYNIEPAKAMTSPAELLMDRKLRSLFPSQTKQLKPKFNIEDERIALKKRQISQNKYANKHETVFSELHNNT